MLTEHFWDERGIYYRATNIVPGRCTLVFIHGFLGSSSAWREYERFFADKFNLIGVDMRGYGTSRKPKSFDAYTVEGLASDIAALLEYLHIDQYVPVSHSGGTLVSVALLRARPHGARATIVMSPIFGITKLPLAHIARPVLRFVRWVLNMTPFPSKTGTHIDYQRFKGTGDWNIRRISVDLPDTTPHVFFSVLSHAYERDLDEWWKEITVPALVIQGDEDSISPIGEAHRLVTAIPNATLAVITGGNHMIPINHFEEVSAAVDSFLARVISSA